MPKLSCCDWLNFETSTSSVQLVPLSIRQNMTRITVLLLIALVIELPLRSATTSDQPTVHVCDSSCTHFQLGLDAAKKGDWPKVIVEFSFVIEARADSASLCAAHINRGRARLMSEDTQGALVDFEAALKANPRSAEAMSWRASCYSRKGDQQKAVEDCAQAIEFDSKETLAFSTRAMAYVRMKEYTKALADYTEVLKLNPKDFAALLGRALTRERLKNIPGAIEDLEAALAIDPSYKKASQTLKRLRAEGEKPKPEVSVERS